MKLATKILLAALPALLFGAPARAGDAQVKAPAEAAKADIAKTFGFVPDFFQRFPQAALPGAWEEMKTLQLNPHTALSPKVKELIGLAVAAQIPCHYCTYAHTQFAQLGGATPAEIGEAVAMAGITRHWSTVLNGVQTDETKFRGEITRILDNVKKASAAKAPPPPAIAVVDGESAARDAAQTLGGYAPEFITRFPAVARAGAWRQFKDVQLGAGTSLSGKEKELIGLAVASQVPCRYCVIAHTEFAKLNGATEPELAEAVAMAALTRDLSTMLNGMQVDEAQFRRDVTRLVKGAKAAAAKSGVARAR